MALQYSAGVEEGGGLYDESVYKSNERLIFFYTKSVIRVFLYFVRVNVRCLDGWFTATLDLHVHGVRKSEWDLFYIYCH